MSVLAEQAAGTSGGSPPAAEQGVDLAVATRGLTKRFGSQVAVDAVDLAVPTGAVYGFLGPNGSGKTTTIRMLLGLVRANAGSIHLLGAPMPSRAATVLPRVGPLVEGPAFHAHLSGRANLARLDALDRLVDPATSRVRVDAALDRVGLLAAARKRYRAYSLGMRQRLALAAALLVPRDLLVLDEPTNGLDPQGTREVRHLVADLAASGATVLVSSHLLAEIEQICTHLGIMSEGALVAQGTLAQIQSRARVSVDVLSGQPEQAAAVLGRLGLVDVVATRTGASGAQAGIESEAIVAALVEAGVGVRGFTSRAPRLEDLYVSLTGEGFRVNS